MAATAEQAENDYQWDSSAHPAPEIEFDQCRLVTGVFLPATGDSCTSGTESARLTTRTGNLCALRVRLYDSRGKTLNLTYANWQGILPFTRLEYLSFGSEEKLHKKNNEYCG